MKKNLLLVFVLCIPAWLVAQNPVPNPGFENWTAGNPDDWTANNFGPGASPILQEPGGHTGTSALRGEVIAVGPTSFFPIVSSTDASANGFVITQPYAALSFYYKTNIVATTTTFNAFVEIYDGFQTPMGGGGMTFNGIVSSYTLATIPISYFGPGPVWQAAVGFTIDDTVTVPAVGEYFIVDDVELTGSVGLQENQSLQLELSKVQPNPASGSTDLYYALPVRSNLVFELFDLTGRICKQVVVNGETAGKHKIGLDVSDVAPGSYIICMSAGEERQLARLQVVH